MKALYLFFLLLPVCSMGQQPATCRPSDRFWSLGAGVVYPRGETAVGFHVSHNRAVLGDGLFVGAGAGAMKFQQIKSLYIPVSLHLTYLPVNKVVNPVIQLSPGYGFLRTTEVADGKNTALRGGFTFYGGGGISFGNSMLTAGYSIYTFNGETRTQKTGPSARLSVLL